MAITKFTPDEIVRAGKKPTVHTGLSNADTFVIPNDGRTSLRITTKEATTKVTIKTTGLVDGQAIADREYNMAKNETLDIGPFPTDEYNNEEGQIEVTFSVTTEVSVEAKKLGR
jgi:hypothetical protein